METSEEKTEEIHATTTTTTNSSSQCSYVSLIPFDITREILVRLPAKSLMRFRCVSRQWASVTSDQEFINSFTTHSSSMQRSCFMLNFQKNSKQSVPEFINSFTTHSSSMQRNDLEICLPVEKYHLTLQKVDRYMYRHLQFQSVHGLVSYSNTYDIVIWNPTMREYITFRKPYKSTETTKTYLGYDPMGKTYKLLSMLKDRTVEPHVLTLGAKESSWRKIKSIPTPFLPHQGICIDGVLFFMCYENGRRELMSFNVRTEKFNFIPAHSRMHDYGWMIGDNPLLSYKERLAWVFIESSVYKLWVLEDADNAKWSCKDFHLPLYLEGPTPSSELLYFLCGVTNDGQFIYLSISWPKKAVYFYYYDPEGNSNNTRIKIEILEDEDLWVQTHTTGRWEFKGIFLNHIENIMSVNQLTCSPSEPFVRVS